MITVTKTDSSVIFEFEDNGFYLNNGTIEMPFNSLILVEDESDALTFRKASTNDILFSALYTEFAASKEDAVALIEDAIFAEQGGGGGGSGVTPSQVESMIDEALVDYPTEAEVQSSISAATSGKADDTAVTSVYQALTAHTDDTSIHFTTGQVKTQIDDKVDPINAVLTAHTADTSIHFTTAAVQTQISSYVDDKIVALTRAEYEALSPKDPTVLYIITDEDVEDYMTSAETAALISSSISGKVDTSAMSAYTQQSDFAAHSGNTGIHTTTAEKAVWNGKQDALVSGTNIKTINSQSLLGSGNITIGGGGGSYQYYTEDTSNESATIMVQNDDGLGNRSENRVFVDGGNIIIESYNETDDGEGNTGTTDTQVDIKSLGLSIIAYSDDGIDTTQTELEVQPMGAYINSEPIATESYVDAAVSGKIDTSAITTAVTSASTDAEIPTAKATYDAITAATTGGGATYSAGTNISIDSANTISCTLPITAGTGQRSILQIRTGAGLPVASGKDSIAFGYACEAKNDSAVAIGATNKANAARSFVYGYNCNGNGTNSCVFGQYLNNSNICEAAFGQYNNSVTGSTDADKTLFSVGNGTSSARHNAFEIRKNGDIYVNDGTNDVKLQDTITGTAANTTALGGLKLVSLTQSEYDQLATKDSATIYFIKNNSN